MSQFLNRLVADDFVWAAISEKLPSKRKRTREDINFDCPMCVSRGHRRADRRMRCGIKNDALGIAINCFNCGFHTKWSMGEAFSHNLREFMIAIGIDPIEIQKLAFKSFQYRAIIQKSPEALALLPSSFVPSFESKALPKGARRISDWVAEGTTDQNFLDTIQYLYSRGEEIAEAAGFDYYWTPNEHHSMHRRIIIPFRHEGMTVGYSGRAIDGTHPRYYTDTPENFLFNNRVLADFNRKYAILVEGLFDAIAVDAVGLQGARLNARQIAWIKSFGKTVIMVPDRDTRGQDMIDVALQQNWHVSFPSLRESSSAPRFWEPDVKDAAEATKRYGRLWTLLSIIESATNTPMKINTYRKWLV